MDIGDYVNKFIDRISEFTVIYKILDNVLFVSLLITCIVVLLVVGIFYGRVPNKKYKIYKLWVYTSILVTGILLIHNACLLRRYDITNKSVVSDYVFKNVSAIQDITKPDDIVVPESYETDVIKLINGEINNQVVDV